MGLVFVIYQDDLVCGNRVDHAIILGNNADTGVYGCLVFHTGADKRTLGLEQRHSLTLHIGAHQRTVCVVVFQERDHGGCDGDYHLRGNVHEVNTLCLNFQDLIPETTCDLCICEVTVFCQRFVRLCDNVVIFHIRSHVDYFICNAAGLLVHTAVRCLNKTVLVDPCESCQIRDQTDVRTFRRLDRAHSSVVAVVYVTYLESGTVTGQTARAQCGQTTLVGQFCQRIVLVHELRQRRGAEEFLDCGSDRTDVDQCLGGDDIHILCLDVHALPDHTLHTGETDAELVLEQFAYRTDTAVAQVVDVVDVADTVAQVQEVTDGSIDIIQDDVLRHQFICTLADGAAQFVLVCCAVQDLTEYGIAYLFADAQLLAVKADILIDIDHAVADDLDFLFHETDLVFAGLGHEVFLGLSLDECLLDACLLDLHCLIEGQRYACLKEDLAGCLVYHRTGQLVTCQTAGDAQLFIVLIAAEPAEVIPLCIKEQVVQMCQRAFHRRRLARTQLFVYVDQRIFRVLGGILLEDGLGQTLVAAEHLCDLLVRTDAQGTDKGRDRDLAVFIDADIDHIVGIHFIFQPCATVRDNGSLEQILTGPILFRCVINARRTHQLRNNNTFCTIDDKGTAFGHQREVAHEDLALLDFTGLLVPERCCHTQRRCIGNVTFLALCNCIFGGVIDPVVCEVQYQIAVVIRNGRNVTKDLFQSFFPEPLVRVLLYLDQVRHFQNFVDLTEVHANVFPALLWRNLHHWRKTSLTLCQTKIRLSPFRRTGRKNFLLF